jgi:carbon-monoxide dehydrogenase large subunit
MPTSAAIHKDGPFGAKGIAEGVLVGIDAAIANALYNAVGVRIKDAPLTAEKVLKAIRAKEVDI